MKRTFGEKIFDYFNYVFLVFIAILCIAPIMNVLAISFSSSTAATAGVVKMWPVGFNLESYKFALTKPEFINSFLITLKRVCLGVVLEMLLTILAAYPLSKERQELMGRNALAFYFFITMIFNGGLIPWYMTIKQLHLIDSIWALVLPGAVAVFSVIVLMNFFRQLPKEISESAIMDGAGHWTILWKMYVPLSTPALATLTLFSCVHHWNSWFDGMILMNSPEHYPLQTYLRSIIVSRDLSTFMNASADELKLLAIISDRTLRASQVFIAALPILFVYPFLQKYFMKGLVMGSVKG
ncbi:carbohydrate ABC transporter permease [Paenibacillus sp. NPDC056579]|uniref:carbohydrate ABC transporter permease n=1 Tax=Paenibacillus sp. NPDC056579 TaxID=3345871 RepID=UPI0036C74A75